MNLVSKRPDPGHHSSHIKSWPPTERPRERLMEKGAEVLSDAELLAILLRSGIKGKDAIMLSRDILGQFGGLRGLFSSEWNKLLTVKGLGPAKTATLMALIELAKRQLKEGIFGKDIIKDPESVIHYLYGSLRDEKREIFKLLFLNKANQVIGVKDLFEGTIDETAVHPREVVRAALDNHAAGLILVHNHPSGRIQPSPEDVQITRRLEATCASVSVKILDHLIIGDNQYFSFREHGHLT